MALSPTQLKQRQNLLASTDASAILGLSEYKSAIAVLLEKIGQPLHVEQNTAMWAGSAFEGPLAKKYAEETEQTVKRNGRTIKSKKHKWMGCTPDAFVYEGKKRLWGLEIKCAFSKKQAMRWGKAGKDVPPEYLVQCHWCMICTGLDRWDMAVLIAGYAGAEFRRYTLKADEGFHNKLIELGRGFWEDYVRPARADIATGLDSPLPAHVPPPEGIPSAALALKAMYPEVHSECRMAMANEDTMATDFQVAKEARIEAVREEERLKQKLIKAIGDAEGIEGEGFRITMRPNVKGTRLFKPTYWEV